MKVKRTILAVLVLLAGCGPSSRGPSSRELAPAPMRVVAFGLSPADAARAEDAARFALEEARRLHGAVRVDVLELHAGEIPGYPGNAGRSWWGPSGTRIAVVVGPDLSCEWTFHEAMHARFFLEDHADPRWPGWEAERLAVVAAWRAR